MRKTNSALGWLIRPAVVSSEPRDRRAHLLAWLLLFILMLNVAAVVLVLIVNPIGSPRYGEYMLLVLGLLAVAAFAYGLNWAGHYDTAAWITVGIGVIGPWGSAMLDPIVLRGDFVPLVYVVLPVLLSSVLLRPVASVVLAAMQLGALTLVMIEVPATASVNWPSLLSFVAFTSVLSISASAISRRDLAQIDQQTLRLAQSEARMRELSIRDPLTDLFNRRYMEETLQREIARADRERIPLAVIMMDIDHFKRFNDELGHAAGDAVLQELGKLLFRGVRSADVACRYGGEELLLVLPGASLDVARQRAERVRSDVKNLQVERGGRPLGTITVSLGVAIFPDHGSTGEAVLESADAALYRAKNDGRDRVVVAD